MKTCLTCKQCRQDFGVTSIFGLCNSADQLTGELCFHCPMCESTMSLTIENDWIIAGGREELPDPVIVEHQRIYLPGIITKRDSSGITVTVSNASYFIPFVPSGFHDP